MRRPSLFKERDVRRATKAVLAVGLEIDRVEIAKDGRIIVVPARLEKKGSMEANCDGGGAVIETPDDLKKLI
jgi:hypothetical protein